VKSYIGGQAIIEGVMMKGPKRIAAACRRPDGRIVVKTMASRSATRFFPLNLPFLRGIVFLFEMLVIGVKALSWSADRQLSKKQELSTGELVFTLSASLLLAVGLFLVVPYAAAWVALGHPSFWFNLVEGLVRLVVFLLYIGVIGRAHDVKRMYQYHGAEHAVVNCYEDGQDLTMRNALRYSTVHVRCGTSLLIYVIAISIVVFSLFDAGTWYYNLLLRLLLIPVIGGIGYELLRLSARFQGNAVLWLLALPGTLTQRITAKRPNARQVEVALVALKRVL
jgi:uncharacterized protein YqhQ